MRTRESSEQAPVVVHVIEDDELSRIASAQVLRTAGYVVRVYSTAAEFLANPPAEPGCLVLDLRLPGPSGLDLQERLMTAENSLPIVFLTGYGDVPKTVRAMRAGAVDFLSKPLSDERLISCLDAAVKGDASDQE